MTAEYDTVVRWFKIAADKAERAGRKESALLWRDGLSHLEQVTAELDAAITWIRVVGEETVLAGLSGGDRDQTLVNVRTLIAERDALAKDATRYRWLRAKKRNSLLVVRAEDEFNTDAELCDVSLDAAVDAALATPTVSAKG